MQRLQLLSDGEERAVAYHLAFGLLSHYALAASEIYSDSISEDCYIWSNFGTRLEDLLDWIIWCWLVGSVYASPGLEVP